MDETFPTILLTRPSVQSRRFADALRARIGPRVPILISPILDIRTLKAPALAERPAFLVLTSANAAEAISGAPPLHGLTAYCVGEATAAAATRAGATGIAAGGTAQDLAARIAADAPAGRGLYLRGRHVSVDLEEILEKSGTNVDTSVVYDQEALPLSDEARSLLAGSGRVVLPLFSARSARLLADACRGASATLVVVAMSDQVAAEWPTPAAIAAMASDPTAEAMIEAIATCLAG